MDAGLKSKWVEALRSGKYQQSRKMLLDTSSDSGETSYCCIGVGYVACVRPEINFGDDTYEAAERLGIGDDDIIETLIDLNDMREKSFTEIADYIEENL